MNEIERGKVEIGTKEYAKLKPEKVKIFGYKVEMQKDRNEKDVGEKVSFICKHPDKPENIEISSIAYRKGKEIRTSGTWYQLDEDKLIAKNSALAILLVSLKAINLDETTGKEIATELDDRGYLVFKAY